MSSVIGPLLTKYLKLSSKPTVTKLNTIYEHPTGIQIGAKNLNTFVSTTAATAAATAFQGAGVRLVDENGANWDWSGTAYAAAGSSGGGVRAPYLGPVSFGSVPTFNTQQGSLSHINQGLVHTLMDDADYVYFEFTLQSGFNYSAAGGPATIEMTVAERAGAAFVPVTFGGSTVGSIPATGVIRSDKFTWPSGKKPRGHKYFSREYIAYGSSGSGINGHHRNNTGQSWPKLAKLR